MRMYLDTCHEPHIWFSCKHVSFAVSERDNLIMLIVRTTEYLNPWDVCGPHLKYIHLANPNFEGELIEAIEEFAGRYSYKCKENHAPH